MVGGGDPFYLKFWVNEPRWSEIADFEPIFACSTSAATPSEKSSINTNRKFTTCTVMALILHFVSQFQSSTFGQTYNASCRAVSPR